MKNFIAEEREDAGKIIQRFKNRDFSGIGGQVIKNSSYQLLQNLALKIGSLFFTIILARMLLPERMGLYNLALATILMFMALSDLGIYSAITTFGSKMLGKNNPAKAKGYIMKLLQWKMILVLIASLAILVSANYLASVHYNKPIFYAILVGVLYIPIFSALNSLEVIFKTTNNFWAPMIKEIFFQIIRLILVPISILLFLRLNLSNGVFVSLVLLTITLCYFFATLALLATSKKDLKFTKYPSKNLTKKEKKGLVKFLLPLSAMSLSGIFFGYIDTFMLGHYVSGQFIAYYGAALSLAGSEAILISFIASSLAPTFSRLKGPVLERVFRKTKGFTIIISLIAGLITYLVSHWIILRVYGSAYLNSVFLLRLFSLLIIISPTVEIYKNYYLSQERTRLLSSLLVGTTLLNILLNFIAINYGLIHYGEYGAVIGAVGATLLSRGGYLVGLIWMKK